MSVKAWEVQTDRVLLGLSRGGCQGLGADFRRKSEIRELALWGGKAGTDRLLFFMVFQGVGWLIPDCTQPSHPPTHWHAETCH